MGHRHLLGSSQMLDDEHDQTRSVTNDNRSDVYSVENMASEGMSFSSHWNSSPRPNGYMPSGHGLERPHYNSEASGPSHDPFLTSSAVGTFNAPPENYVPYASSSNYNTQAWSSSNCDLSMGNVRGAQKRKSPCASSISERGSSSQCHGDRSSSDIPLPSELHPEKPIADPRYMLWDQLPVNPTYRSNGLSIRGEASSRNVRSRPALDLETSLARNHLPSNPGLGSDSTTHFIDHPVSGDFPAQTSHAVNRDWNCARLSPAPGEINGFGPETNTFLPGRSVANSTPLETTGYQHGITNRNSIVSHNFPGTSTQSASSVHSSSYSHRSVPTYRASSSGLRLGHIAPPEERSHLVTETYPSRHLRPLPHISWRSSDRAGRRRSSYERFHQPHLDDASLHERFSSEGFMVVDHPGYYASRNIFDQHRDMRLDIDNMTYEELLALGERIGSVNTGLSNTAIAKCLEETTYFLSHQTEEQKRCVICLEEYEEKEGMGKLKGCGHEYHGSCIKKWLSMKNSCPICKATALSDHLK